MNTSQLKSYAPPARTAFIDAVTRQAALLGITKDGAQPAKVEGDVLLVEGQAFPKAYDSPRQSLAKRCESQGFDATMEAIAYTWFNRFVAIRYMELHGYLDHGYRVLSHPEGEPHPEILDHAADVDLPGLDPQKVMELKLDGNKDEELYRLLLKAQCNALHQAMPFLFEKIGDETELLLPANLLHTDSLIRQLVSDIDEELWQDIEIIGWLYQFYISEKKDQVIGKVVKSEDIPAATQLFTPNWIVKYMVQNSLGAQWLATYPDSPLKAQMEYYIEPAEQTDEVNAQLAAITPSSLNPEELTLMDPACGSGHILVEAYDLFKAIYLERGYRERDVPQLILEKNLFGLDIDQRAAQLTGFALMMKGRADDRRLFSRGVQLNVIALRNSTDLDIEALALGGNLAEYGLEKSDLAQLKNLFEHTATFGSLIQIPDSLSSKIENLEQLSQADTADLFARESLVGLKKLTPQIRALAAHYTIVVANPPYMGNRYQSTVLREFLRHEYRGFDKDTFSAFILRCISLAQQRGRLGFMSPFVWMFISSHEQLRRQILRDQDITSLVQLEYSGFDGATVPICTFCLQKGHVAHRKGCFIRLADFPGSENQAPRTLEAIRNRKCGWFYEASQDSFERVPGSPIAYWAADALARAFEAEQNIGNSSDFTGSQNKTGDNERFLRRFWEVDFKKFGERWIGYSKGGAFRRWFGNLEYVVDWSESAQDFYKSNSGSNKLGEQFQFRSGITYSDITSGAYSARFLPEGHLFDMKGPTFHPTKAELEVVLAALNSPVGNYIFKILNPTLTLQAREVKAFPILPISGSDKLEVVNRTKSLIEISAADWDSFETSWSFSKSPLLNGEPTIESSFELLVERARTRASETLKLERENAQLFVASYGLEEALDSEIPLSQVSLRSNPVFRYGGKLTEDEQWTRFRGETMEELLSYAIGCMMGRYSLDEPGLVYAYADNNDFEPSKYGSFPSDDDGIVPLADTAWFPDDACNRMVEFISTAWNRERLEENIAFLADNLSPKKNESPRDTIRRYLTDSFFKAHIKTYKKRPIYWLISSGRQKAFQALIYLHRYNEGTLARLRNDYVIPLQGKMAARIEQLTADIPAATSSKETKRLTKEKQKLEKQQTELLAFDEKLRHFADKRIHLDLDDGVKVNYGKFGDLLAEVKAIHGKKPEVE